MIELDDMDLMHLRDCASSTRLGMVDQGFPSTMERLAIKGLVEKKGAGYVVTLAGINFLHQRDTKGRVRQL